MSDYMTKKIKSKIYYEKIFFNTRHYIEKYIRKTYNAIIRMLNQAF